MTHSLPDNGIFLHVACGRSRQQQTPFANLTWSEVRLDRDPAAEPDHIGSLTDLSAVAEASVDAVYTFRSLERLYPHEVGLFLAAALRVLKPGGFLLLSCTDLKAAARLIVGDQYTEPAYQAAQGPIAAIDLVYGNRSLMAAGRPEFAHHCGFTSKALVATLQGGGFPQVAALERPDQFDIWALATKETWPDEQLQAAAQKLFPAALPPTNF